MKEGNVLLQTFLGRNELKIKYINYEFTLWKRLWALAEGILKHPNFVCACVSSDCDGHSQIWPRDVKSEIPARSSLRLCWGPPVLVGITGMREEESLPPHFKSPKWHQGQGNNAPICHFGKEKQHRKEISSYTWAVVATTRSGPCGKF